MAIRHWLGILCFTAAVSVVAIQASAATISSNVPLFLAASATGPDSLGTGTASLVGGDRTDPEDDGDPENNINYNATFFASEEPSFGGGEAAFNVFDNQVGGGNAKWCCGDQNNFPVNPIIVGADFGVGNEFALESFTVTSGNDSPERDPRVWEIQGSNDGLLWETIFAQNNPNSSLWTQRDEVLEFTAGADFPVQTDNFQMFRMITTLTGATGGARFQLNEIELFGNFAQAVPEPASIALWSLLGLVSLGIAWARIKR